MLVAILISILILLILVATAHIWCRIIRRSPCCDKSLDSVDENWRENDERHPANIERGVASVTGFVLEATAPTSTRVLELSMQSSRKPLTMAQIERLPRKIVTDFRQTENCQSKKTVRYFIPKYILGNACTICMMEFESNDVLLNLGCGHDFHYDCIKNWLLVKNECPVCRSKVE